MLVTKNTILQMGGDQENASHLVGVPTKMIDVGRFNSVLTAYENNIVSCSSDLKEDIQDLIKSLHVMEDEIEKETKRRKLSVTQEEEKDHVVDEDDDDDDEDEAVHRIDPTAQDSIIRCNEAADDVIIHCTVCNSQIKQQKSRTVPIFLKKRSRRTVKKKMKHKKMADIYQNCLQVSSQETIVKKKCSFVQSLKKIKKKFNGKSRKRKAESTASNDKRIVSETFHSVDSPTIEGKWLFQTRDAEIKKDESVASRLNNNTIAESSIDRKMSLRKGRCSVTANDRSNELINKDEQNEKTFRAELLTLQNHTITHVMEKEAVESIDEVKSQNDQKISTRYQKRCEISDNDLQLLNAVKNFIQSLHNNKFQDDDFGEDDLEFPFKRDGSFRHVMSAKHHEFRKRFGNIGKHYTQEFLHRVFTEETIIEYGLNRNQLCLGSFENLPDALIRVETAIPGYKVSKVCENLKEVCQHEVAKYIIDSITED